MEEVTIPEDRPTQPARKSFFNEKRRIVFVYIPIVAFASSLIALFLAKSPFITADDLVAAIAYGILILMWCQIDARERDYKLSHFFTFAVVLFSVFSLVYYLFRSRGLKGGLMSTGLLIAYIAALFVLLMIALGVAAVFLVTLGVLPKSTLEG